MTTTTSRELLLGRGFVHLATFRTHPVEQYAIEHLPGVPTRNIVYVAARDDEILYVGKAVSFRARYNHGHVRWLRGEKKRGAQWTRWVAVLAAGPVPFYGRVHPGNELHDHEERLIDELQPTLNVARRRKQPLPPP